MFQADYINKINANVSKQIKNFLNNNKKKNKHLYYK